MRGKIKDAEAEALLKLLRREQENEKEQSILQIQRKEPLPAIGNNIKGNSCNDSSCFPIQEQLLSLRMQSSTEAVLSDNEILNDSSFIRTNNNNILSLPGHKTTSAEIYVPPYSWQNDKVPSTSRPGKAKNGRTLPPIDYNSIASVGSDLNQTKPAYSQESLPPRSPEYCKD